MSYSYTCTLCGLGKSAWQFYCGACSARPRPSHVLDSTAMIAEGVRASERRMNDAAAAAPPPDPRDEQLDILRAENDKLRAAAIAVLKDANAHSSLCPWLDHEGECDCRLSELRQLVTVK